MNIDDAIAQAILCLLIGVLVGFYLSTKAE
jgi:uncharacterized protein YneF (UPF0154 family)